MLPQRCLAALLALAGPAPAWALRPTSEGKAKVGVEEALGPSAEAEEALNRLRRLTTLSEPSRIYAVPFWLHSQVVRFVFGNPLLSLLEAWGGGRDDSWRLPRASGCAGESP